MDDNSTRLTPRKSKPKSRTERQQQQGKVEDNQNIKSQDDWLDLESDLETKMFYLQQIKEIDANLNDDSS